MIWYLIGINLVTFLLYGIDKYCAKNKLYRISEYSLFTFSFFGGCIGSLLGMKIFHHKTKKLKFWIINILLTILWIIFLIYFSKNLT